MYSPPRAAGNGTPKAPLQGQRLTLYTKPPIEWFFKALPVAVISALWGGTAGDCSGEAQGQSYLPKELPGVSPEALSRATKRMEMGKK